MTSAQLLTGALLGVAVASLAYLARTLSVAGAVTAAVVGTLVFGFGGPVAAILLLLFFISSSALTRVGGRRKDAFADVFAKGGRRDPGQVLANGGVAAIASTCYGLSAQGIWMVTLAGALAAVNADTWATELGILLGRRPRLITTGVRVEPGTSGGVTAQGVAAALAGAALIAAAGGALLRDWRLGAAAAVGGLAGALGDSLLGATLQGIYFCPACGKETERHPMHTCGTETVLRRGRPWLGNDLVNLSASLIGAVVAVVVWWVLLRP
jgi:uncharacterized protein (TIGR00297 family)